MVSRRILAAAAAIACGAGMAVTAALPGVAQAVPASPATAAPRTLPSHVFAPYYFNAKDTLAATSKASAG